jgi:hypothetical protein
LALSVTVSHRLLARSPSLPAAGAVALTQLLDTTARRGDVPAVVVLVTNADGVMFEHAAGRRDVGANALWGGSNNTIALQPLSGQGQIGLGVAGGISAMDLRPAEPVRGRRHRHRR